MSTETELIFQKYIKMINESQNKISISNDDKLEFYKYYKQATIGDCETVAPSMFNITDNIKWNAWNSIKGLSKEEAMKKIHNVSKKLYVI